MHQEKYTLTWHTYSEHLRKMMKELKSNDDFADVTLVTEDKKHIQAQRNILSACSPVFKDILQQEKRSNATIYLRGIKYTELESILQFIYLGEATFYEERMNEFLAVARSLEIKAICNAETESNDDDELSPSDPVTSPDNSEEKPLRPSQAAKTIQDRREVIKTNDKCECHQCDFETMSQDYLKKHIESKHEGIKYACNQSCLSGHRRHMSGARSGAPLESSGCSALIC